jgi:DNA-binding beta-propeller fold protein YncE
MSLFPMNAGQAQGRLVQAGVALVAAALIAGCGSEYRPVVTPISPSGPAAQPQSLAAVVSSPSSTSDGVATIIDYSGDTVMATTPIGPNPTAFTLDATGTTGYAVNSDGTLTNFQISTKLQEQNLQFTTLPTTSQPVNLFSPNAGLWAGDLNGNIADIFVGYPETFKLAVPVAATPITVVGPGTGALRNYVISQVGDSNGVDCNNSPATVPTGLATAIETSNDAADTTPIPLGRCPVYGVESSDGKRLFVLNRGDDTITVINTQFNTLDACTPFVDQTGQTVTCHPTLPLSTTAVTATGITPPNGTTGMTAIAGPVYAEYNAATSQLVVADYIGGTISVIDVSLDVYGNDSPTFGTTFTIKVGNTATPYPASVTVLSDGSRAYTANQGDDDGKGNGTVSIVYLSGGSDRLEKTLSVTGHPRTVVSTSNSLYGKVYVASPDSQYLTILRTDQDIVDTTILIEGNIVDVRVSSQNGSSNVNSNINSRVPGYGQPCNLPPTAAATTLAACQAIPY